jgi:hypothetical protein
VTRRRIAVLLAMALLGSPCTRSAAPDHRPVTDGFILLEVVSGSTVGDRLSITGLDGGQGEIDVPAPALGLATEIPGKAVYTTGSGSVFLVDAHERVARRLDIPPDAGVIFNPILFGQAERFIVLASPAGDAGYLVDLQTGAASNLIGLAGAEHLFSAEFSPDGEHLAFFGDQLVLVPTAHPADATRLGRKGGVGFAGFSEDGQKVASIDVGDPGQPKLVIQSVDGSISRTVDLPPGTTRAHLLGRGARAVLEEQNRLSIIDVGSGRARPLAPFRGTPRLSWFGPGGRTALFGSGSGDRVSWDWLDLEHAASRHLTGLGDYRPLLSSPSDRYVFFSDGAIPGPVRSFRLLDMETGHTQSIFSFGRARTVDGYQIATGGTFALIPAEQGRGGELRVLSATGAAHVIASSTGGLPLGTFSPSGDWVAMSKPPGPGRTPTVVAVSTSGGETKNLVQGVRPVWLRGD